MDWKDTGAYKQLISRSVIELLSILSYMIKQDPDALIILIGDHGPRRFRHFIPSPFPGDAAFDERCAKFHLTREKIAQDMFNVLLAVRMPGGKQDISQGYNLSHRNLFVNIFSQLSGDPTIPRWRKPSISQNADDLIMVKEGKVLQQWINDSSAN